MKILNTYFIQFLNLIPLDYFSISLTQFASEKKLRNNKNRFTCTFYLMGKTLVLEPFQALCHLEDYGRSSRRTLVVAWNSERTSRAQRAASPNLLKNEFNTQKTKTVIT